MTQKMTKRSMGLPIVQTTLKRGSTSRKCGSCNVCCTIMGVPDMEPEPKEPFSVCPHLGGETKWKRCTIYEDRPEGCSAFLCEWLRGAGSSKDRPDKSFILAHFEHSALCDGREIGESVVLTELREQAFERNSGCRNRFERHARQMKYNVIYQRMNKDVKK